MDCGVKRENRIALAFGVRATGIETRTGSRDMICYEVGLDAAAWESREARRERERRMLGERERDAAMTIRS